MAAGKQDQLIDILQQIQLRKSVKAEDATRALRQYYRVQDQIKQLKEDIELLKSNQKLPDQVYQKPAVIENRSPNMKRKASTTSINTVSTGSPMTRRISTNMSSPRRSLPGTRDSTFADKSERSNMRAVEEEMTNGFGPGSTMNEKDKEIARLRLQNTQLKVLVERRVSSTINGEKPKSSPNGPVAEQPLAFNFPSQMELVGEFKKIHNQEWRSTFHDIEKHYKCSEEVVTDILAAIAKEAYQYCMTISKQQFEDIGRTHSHVTDIIVQPKYISTNRDVYMAKSKTLFDKEGYRITRRFLKEYRKALAKVSIPGIMELYEGHVHREILPKLASFRVNPKTVRPYIHRLIEIVWLMSVTEPPFFQVWQRPGQLMNREQFTAYSKKGATIIHTVWPAILQHKDGDLLEKGVCLVK